MKPVFITTTPDEARLNRLKEKSKTAKPVWEQYAWCVDNNKGAPPAHLQILAQWHKENWGITRWVNAIAWEYDEGYSNENYLFTVSSIIKRQFLELGELIEWAQYTCVEAPGSPLPAVPVDDPVQEERLPEVANG